MKIARQCPKQEQEAEAEAERGGDASSKAAEQGMIDELGGRRKRVQDAWIDAWHAVHRWRDV